MIDKFACFIIVGGGVSLLATTIVLIMLIRNKNTHVCNSSLIYNYMSARIGSALMYSLEGLFLCFFKSKCPDIKRYVGSILTGLDSSVYLYGNLISILILWNIYKAFKNPLTTPTKNIRLILSSLGFSVLCGIGMFLLDKLTPSTNQKQFIYVISFVGIWKIYCEIFLRLVTAIASLILFIRMRRTLASYQKMNVINSFLRILCWFVFLFLVLNLICIGLITIPLVHLFKSDYSYQVFLTVACFSPLVQMVPFIYTLISFSSPVHSKEAINVNISKIRYEYVTSILKGISSCFGDKCKTKDKSVLIPLLSDSDASTDVSDRLSNKSYSTSLSQDEIEGHHSQILSNRIKIIEIAPYHFDKIRERYNISSKVIANMFTINQYYSGKVSAYLKGEEFYIVNNESNIIIKSLTKDEYSSIHQNLKYFCGFMEINIDHMLQPILGIYEISHEHSKVDELYIILTLKNSEFKKPYIHKIRPKNNYLCNIKQDMKTAIDLKTIKFEQLIENKNAKLQNFYLPAECMKSHMQLMDNTIEMIKKLQSTKYALQFDYEFKQKEIIEGKQIENYLNNYLTKIEISNKIFFYKKGTQLLFKELHATYSIEYHISSISSAAEIENLFAPLPERVANKENIILAFSSESFIESSYKEQTNGKYALCPFQRQCEKCNNKEYNHIIITNYTGCKNIKMPDHKRMTQLIISDNKRLMKLKICMAFTQYFNVNL